MLVASAFSISFGWGIGVLVPFGPLLFRLSYPEQAARARVFGLIALPCYLGFFAFGPPVTSLHFHREAMEKDLAATRDPAGYRSESGPVTPVAAPNAARSLEERRVANEAEFNRLHSWNEKLQAMKRDLLKSDLEGTRRYNDEATQFNAALAAANAEKTALDSAR